GVRSVLHADHVPAVLANTDAPCPRLRRRFRLQPVDQLGSRGFRSGDGSGEARMITRLAAQLPEQAALLLEGADAEVPQVAPAAGEVTAGLLQQTRDG